MTATAKGRLISFCSYVASQGRHRLQKPCSSQPSIRWLVNEAAEGSAQFIGNTPNKWGSDLRLNLLVRFRLLCKDLCRQPFLMLCVLEVQKAATENDFPVVEHILRQYEHAGRHPGVSSLNAVINMYARGRQVDKALATFSKLTSTPKISPNAQSYRTMLLAYSRVRCSKATSPPCLCLFHCAVESESVSDNDCSQVTRGTMWSRLLQQKLRQCSNPWWTLVMLQQEFHTTGS